MSGQITSQLISSAQSLNANSAPCGIGAGLQSLNEAIDRTTTQINQVINGATDIIAALQTLPAVIAREVSTVATEMIDGLVGQLELPSITLPDEVRILLEAINNPAAFLQQYLRIENLFPDFDLNGLLGQIALPGFNFCSMVPNLQISGGQTTEAANQVPPSASNAEPQPEPAPVPVPEVPPVAPNTSSASQRVIVEQLPPIGENAGLTEQQRQSRTQQYAAELDENNQQRAAILARLESATPGSEEYNSLVDEATRLTNISEQLRANRP
jgi:hypothetical protein